MDTAAEFYTGKRLLSDFYIAALSKSICLDRNERKSAASGHGRLCSEERHSCSEAEPLRQRAQPACYIWTGIGPVGGSGGISSMRNSFMNWSKSGRTFSSSDSSVVRVAMPIQRPLRT